MTDAVETKPSTDRRKNILGKVTSVKMNKTIVVQATRQTKHPKYHKYYNQYKKFKAHDENNECEVGDRVLIVESQPISKEKKFRLRKIVEKVKKAV